MTIDEPIIESHGCVADLSCHAEHAAVAHAAALRLETARRAWGAVRPHLAVSGQPDLATQRDHLDDALTSLPRPLPPSPHQTSSPGETDDGAPRVARPLRVRAVSVDAAELLTEAARLIAVALASEPRNPADAQAAFHAWLVDGERWLRRFDRDVAR